MARAGAVAADRRAGERIELRYGGLSGYAASGTVREDGGHRRGYAAGAARVSVPAEAFYQRRADRFDQRVVGAAGCSWANLSIRIVVSYSHSSGIFHNWTYSMRV